MEHHHYHFTDILDGGGCSGAVGTQLLELAYAGVLTYKGLSCVAGASSNFRASRHEVSVNSEPSATASFASYTRFLDV